MSNQQPKKITLNVAGQTLQVMTPLEESYVQRIAGHLNRRIGAMRNSTDDEISQKTILLAALDLAEEVMSLNRQLRDLHRRNGARARNESNSLTVLDKIG